MHQDAHEMFQFLLNSIAEVLVKELSNPLGQTWLEMLFQGTLTSETKCMTCESKTTKDEKFFDLSVDVEENSSILNCLKNFSIVERLNGNNKFYCDACCTYQEGEKRFVLFTFNIHCLKFERLKIKKAPNILIIHLKRFKFDNLTQRHAKLSHRVLFGTELKFYDPVNFFYTFE